MPNWQGRPNWNNHWKKPHWKNNWEKKHHTKVCIINNHNLNIINTIKEKHHIIKRQYPQHGDGRNTYHYDDRSTIPFSNRYDALRRDKEQYRTPYQHQDRRYHENYEYASHRFLEARHQGPPRSADVGNRQESPKTGDKEIPKTGDKKKPRKMRGCKAGFKKTKEKENNREWHCKYQ